MKFSCARNDLADAVAVAIRAVAAKSSYQALEGIHLAASGDGLTLTGYNLEIGIVDRCGADVYQPGTAVVSAKFFSDIIRKLPGDRVVFESDENGASSISSGIARFELAALTEEDYPEIPAVETENSFSISSDALGLMIAGTVFSTSVSEIKPVQAGVLFDAEGDRLRAAATDNSRLAVRTEKIAGNGSSFRFIIPGNTLREIDKIMKPGDEVRVSVSRKHALMEFSGVIVVSRLLEGEFYRYENALASDPSNRVEVDTADFTESVERVSLLVDEKLKRCIRFTFESEMIKLNYNSPVGRAYDECACSGECPETDIGLNNRFLLEALRAAGTERIKIQFASGSSPVIIRPTEGEDFFYMIAPVRLI